jgi:uncharacterized protein (TIGR02246 family)
MRYSLALALALIVLLTPSLGLAQGAADEQAIRRVIQQYDQARTKGDWKAAAMLFTSDGTTLTSSGEWRRGRAQVEKLGAATGTTAYKGGTFTSTVESVRVLAPTVALADSRFQIANISGGSRRGHSAYVLVKEGDQWRIAAAQSMVPTAVGATKD